MEAKLSDAEFVEVLRVHGFDEETVFEVIRKHIRDYRECFLIGRTEEAGQHLCKAARAATLWYYYQVDDVTRCSGPFKAKIRIRKLDRLTFGPLKNKLEKAHRKSSLSLPLKKEIIAHLEIIVGARNDFFEHPDTPLSEAESLPKIDSAGVQTLLKLIKNLFILMDRNLEPSPSRGALAEALRTHNILSLSKMLEDELK